jgi:hypothetical protein
MLNIFYYILDLATTKNKNPFHSSIFFFHFRTMTQASHPSDTFDYLFKGNPNNNKKTLDMNI